MEFIFKSFPFASRIDNILTVNVHVKCVLLTSFSLVLTEKKLS